jgi:hypothetical protein
VNTRYAKYMNRRITDVARDLKPQTLARTFFGLIDVAYNLEQVWHFDVVGEVAKGSVEARRDQNGNHADDEQ